MEQLSEIFITVGVLMWLFSPIVVLGKYFLTDVWEYEDEITLRVIGSVLIIIGLLIFA